MMKKVLCVCVGNISRSPMMQLATVGWFS